MVSVNKCSMQCHITCLEGQSISNISQPSPMVKTNISGKMPSLDELENKCSIQCRITCPEGRIFNIIPSPMERAEFQHEQKANVRNSGEGLSTKPDSYTEAKDLLKKKSTLTRVCSVRQSSRTYPASPSERYADFGKCKVIIQSRHSESIEKYYEFTNCYFSCYSESVNVDEKPINCIQNSIQNLSNPMVINNQTDRFRIKSGMTRLSNSHLSEMTEKTVKNLFTHSPIHLFTPKKKAAFTLTEVLVALSIVGIIAALVLPAVISNYQNKSFEQAFQRETQTLQSTIEGLPVSENKANFFDTMMYKSTLETDETTGAANYDDSSKAFMQKYLKVSKFCDTNTDCFAEKYYEYTDGDKKVYTPDFKGACAKLKNGMSICLTPQVGTTPIEGVIDLNGTKGPNVFGKDLRTFSISAFAKNGRNQTTDTVLSYDFDPIVPEEEEETDPCEGKTCGCGSLPDCPTCETTPESSWSEECCLANTSKITPGHHCCSFSQFSSSSYCKKQCGTDSSTWDENCCNTNASSVTSSTHHCCSYATFKNNHSSVCTAEQTCHFTISTVATETGTNWVEGTNSAGGTTTGTHSVPVYTVSTTYTRLSSESSDCKNHSVNLRVFESLDNGKHQNYVYNSTWNGSNNSYTQTYAHQILGSVSMGLASVPYFYNCQVTVNAGGASKTYAPDGQCGFLRVEYVLKNGAIYSIGGGSAVGGLIPTF